MMNPEFNDHEMAMISEYYPVVGISQQHLIPDQGVAESVKVRRRRRKGKGGEGGGGGGLMRKRKLSDEQVSMLERSFGNEHKLETERKEQLAAELGLDPRQVAVWFQNRRARWKNKKLEEEFSRLRSHHESTVVEKCRLQTEILKMKEQLKEAEKEIERLCESGGERLRSNSPSSSVMSTETNNNNNNYNNVEVEPQILYPSELGLMEYLDNVFYAPEANYQWNDDHMYNYI